MASSYWSNMLRLRASRRRALAICGGGALAAVALSACGGGSSGSQSQDKSGLLTQPEDTTKQAVRGGVWPTYRTDDALTLDPISNTSSLSWPDMLFVYSHLTSAGLQSTKADAYTGDAAQSWEYSPDGTQITFKLRPNIKFDSRPPTNRRAMTSGDVKWSFDRFQTVSPYRGEIFSSLSPAAPIQSIEAPDDQTIVVKMAFPYGGIIEMLGYINYFYILPREAETFNIKSEMRGSGPFRLQSYVPSSAFEYVRNDDWYVSDRPFLDGVRRSIIPDYASGLAQFESKALWYFGVNQEDILRVKADHPELVLQRELEGALGADNLRSTPYIAISKQPDSPLKDVRLRRAASMLIDRDLWIRTFYATDAFEKAGLPVDTLWHAHLPAGAPSWLDPRGNAIGEGGKYFQHNPAEAKKLLSAAGQEGVALDYFYQNRMGAQDKQNQVLIQMFQENGLLQLKSRQLDYATEWRQVCQYSAGKDYAGFCYNNSGAFNEEAYMVAKYTPQGKYAASYLPIDGVTDAVLAARREIDAQKRSSMIQDIQRKLALEWYDIPLPGVTYEFSLHWPWLKNHGVFNSGGQPTPTTALEFTYLWYDKSKAS